MKFLNIYYLFSMVNMVIKFLLFLTFTFSAFDICAQRATDKIIDYDVSGKKMIEVLFEISSSNDIDFFFDPDDLPFFDLEGTYTQKPIYKILQDITNGSSLLPFSNDETSIYLVKKEKISKDYISNLKQLWEDGSLKYPIKEEIKKISLIFGSQEASKSKVNLTLNLNDGDSNDPIIGAVIGNNDYSINGVSDENGKILLDLPAGNHGLILTYTGYQTIEIDLQIYEPAAYDLEMAVQNVLLSEIEIVARGSDNKINESKVGSTVLNLESIERIPQALGEADIIKSLEILPGVTSVGDMSTGFNVRGGNVDESLVLFNDGIIFNPTHIVGFISSFNSESIDQATLYKGYVDGEFGSRGSAVLDITANAEDVKKFNGNGGLGTSMIKLYLEDKVSEKLSYQFGGRGSFNDFILGLVADRQIQNSNARFYDLNTSLFSQVSDKHKVIFNAYRSKDFFEYNDDFGFEWDNNHVGLKFKSQWNSKFFTQVSLNYGSYNSSQFVLNTPELNDFQSGVRYTKLKANMFRTLNENSVVKLGVEYIRFKTAPDQLVPSSESTLEFMSITRRSSDLFAPYLSVNYDLTSNLTAEFSLRWSNYVSTGPGRINIYENNEPFTESVVDVLEDVNSDSDSRTSILEPRISFNYKVTDDFSFRGGYNRMSQNVMQLSTSNAALPNDIWIFSNRYIPVQIVDQYSLGIFTKIKDNAYDMSLEVFSKDFKNLMVLQEFPDVILNESIETELIPAKGRSYGIEFLAEKNKGKWLGSIAYTYSRSLRQTVSDLQSINSGNEFPANFDIPHQLNVVATYKMLPVVSLNMAYTYKSGRPTTVPVSSILQSGIVVPIYAGRNQERIPYYSRLDVSLTLDMRKAKKNGFRSSFNLGLYNILGRRNAYNVFFRRSTGGNITPFQFSIIGSLVPSFSWNFKF